MNKLAFAGAALAVLMVSAVAFAASPSASPAASPSASPSASPGATASPTAAPQASASPTPATSWTAQVNPVQVTGSATIARQADGTGLLTLQLSGMINEVSWTVDVDAGTLDRPQENVNIAHKAGDDVKRVEPDKIQVRLTAQEMDQFAKALANKGVVIFVSDGTRVSAAVLNAQ